MPALVSSARGIDPIRYCLDSSSSFSVTPSSTSRASSASIDATARLTLAGLTPARTMEAQSLLPALQGEDWKGRDYVFAEHGRDNILTDTDFMTMVRSRDWKLVHFLEEPTGQLFDLRQDPDEVHNLWTDPNHQEKKRELLDVLREWRIRSDVHTSEWASQFR